MRIKLIGSIKNKYFVLSFFLIVFFSSCLTYFVWVKTFASFDNTTFCLRFSDPVSKRNTCFVVQFTLQYLYSQCWTWTKFNDHESWLQNVWFLFKPINRKKYFLYCKIKKCIVVVFLHTRKLIGPNAKERFCTFFCSDRIFS